MAVWSRKRASLKINIAKCSGVKFWVHRVHRFDSWQGRDLGDFVWRHHHRDAVVSPGRTEENSTTDISSSETGKKRALGAIELAPYTGNLLCSRGVDGCGHCWP